MQKFGLIVLMIAAAGCVSPPKKSSIDLDVEIPKEFAAAEAGLSEAVSVERWWQDLNDPSLNAIIERVMDRNPDVALAAARMEAALAQARIQGANLKPGVNAGLTGARRKQNFIGLPIPGQMGVLSTTSTNLGLSIETSWELDLWGKNAAISRQAIATAQATESDLAAIRLSIAGQAAKIWFAVAEADQQIRLNRETVASHKRTVDQVKGRFQRGLAPSLELRLALSSLTNGQARLVQSEELKKRLVRQLQVLLGDYPDVVIDGVIELPELVGSVPAGLPADLISRRPDVASAERRFAAAEQGVKVAKRRLYPSFSLTLSGGTSSSDLGDLLDGDFGVWSLMANLLQPVFQGGRLRAGVDLAGSVLDQAGLTYLKTVLGAYGEVENALSNERSLKERGRFLEESMNHAEKARNLAETRYQAGLTGYLTVLETQRRALLSRSEWINNRRLLLENRIDLYLALGGGFSATTFETDLIADSSE